MNKLIFITLILSTSSFAQTDELTLESNTAPTVMEDGTDLSQTPMEVPMADAPDSLDVTENVNPAKDIPAQLPDTTPAELTNKSHDENTVTDFPNETTGVPHETVETLTEGPTEVVNTPEEFQTPNPTADENKPLEVPEEKIADQVPPPSISTPVITTEAPDDDRYIKHRKSHWISTFGFEGLRYELPFDFEGERRNVRERKQDLYGARVGIGGQLHLGKGLFTTSMIETYYLGTLFTKNQDAGPLVDGETVGSIKRTSGLYGVDVSQNLGYIIEFRTKNPFMDEWTNVTFEPFVEAGIGAAKSFNRVQYEYDSGPAAGNTQVQEGYKRRIRDTLTNARVGAGFNITSLSGFFMQAKVSVNRYDITERKIDTYRKPDDGAFSKEPSTTDKDVKIDPITVFTLGGGYKF